MEARIIIPTCSLIFFVPAYLLTFVSYSNGNANTLHFVLSFPFMGTFPGTLVNSSDGNYWPWVVGIPTAGYAFYAMWSVRPSDTAIYIGILVLFWAITVLRFFVIR